MATPDQNNWFTYGGGLTAGVAFLLWIALKLRELFSGSKATVAADEAKTGLINNLQEERDRAQVRVDELTSENSELTKKYIESVSEITTLKQKVGNLEERIETLIESLEERQQHLDLLVGLLDHLLFQKPLSPDMQHKLSLLRAIGTLAGDAVRQAAIPDPALPRN
jgi:septal ring factor EnvC (AmiA/AmiB activator)